jgi:hypothetical protein
MERQIMIDKEIESYLGESQISPIYNVIDVLNDCIGQIADWFECKSTTREYSIQNAPTIPLVE